MNTFSSQSKSSITWSNTDTYLTMFSKRKRFSMSTIPRDYWLLLQWYCCLLSFVIRLAHHGFISPQKGVLPHPRSTYRFLGFLKSFCPLWSRISFLPWRNKTPAWLIPSTSCCALVRPAISSDPSARSLKQNIWWQT